MKISVIIPTYKPSDYLWECLDSLRNQTISHDQYEVLLILNGCNEPYRTKISTYINENNSWNIIFMQTEEPGVSNARNVGLDKATGDYIVFIDDDDYVSNSYLEELSRISSQDTVGIAYPYAFNDGSPQIQLKYSITTEYERCATHGRQSHLKPKKFFSGPCMKMFHRIIIGNRRFDLRFRNGEDSIFMFEISDKLKYVDFTSTNAVYYRRYRVGSATMSEKKISYVLDNCTKRYLEINKIFFHNFPRYNLYLYITNILGLCHIILNRILMK